MTSDLWSSIRAVAALVLVACGGSGNAGNDASPPPGDSRIVDAASPDAAFVPVHACATRDVALAPAGDTNLHTRFYDSTFFLRADQGLYHVRGTAQPSVLVTSGQSYPAGGADAKLQLLGLDRPQIFVPTGHASCAAFTPLALATTYFVGGNERDVIVLVDDLTGALTQVIAETALYAGSQVSAISLLAESDCGDLALLLSLADGRHLLVRRDAATGAIKTLLGVAAPGGVGGGDAISGAAGRRYGFINRAELDASSVLVYLSVDNDTPARIGMMLARVDVATGAVTCQVTDTDVPCLLTSAPDLTGSSWDHRGDTAATRDGKLVRGGVVAPAFAPGIAVQVCRTGDVYVQRAEGALGQFQEIYVIHRDNRSERVTRFQELARSGQPSAGYIQSFVLGPGCELIVGAGDTVANTFGYWAHWPDGTLATIAPDYRVVGYDANGDLGIRTEAGAHAVGHKPVDCVVPAPQAL